MNFFNDVYRLCKEIPKGKVSTCEDIAKILNTKAYRLVAYALKNNPEPRKIPCHRVLASDGSLCGFNGEVTKRALDRKTRLLEKEGILIKNGKIVELNKYLYKFNR